MIKIISGILLSLVVVLTLGAAVLAAKPTAWEIDGTPIAWEDDGGIVPGLYDIWSGSGPAPPGAIRTPKGTVLVPIPPGVPTSGVKLADGTVIPFAEAPNGLRD